MLATSFHVLLSTINSDLFFLILHFGFIQHVQDNFLELFLKEIELVKKNFKNFVKTITSVMFE